MSDLDPSAAFRDGRADAMEHPSWGDADLMEAIRLVPEPLRGARLRILHAEVRFDNLGSTESYCAQLGLAPGSDERTAIAEAYARGWVDGFQARLEQVDQQAEADNATQARAERADVDRDPLNLEG